MFAQVAHRYIHADMAVGPEHHTLIRHLLQAAIKDAFLHLEFGNAVAHQSADAIVTLVHRDLVAGAAQLLGRRQAGGAAADDRHFLVRQHCWRLGL